MQRHLPGIGRLALAPFSVSRHAPVAHAWLASDHAAFWGMQALSAGEVADYFRRIEDSDTHTAFIGLHDGAPAFLLETYDPAAEPVGKVYPVRAGDRGMHVLVAPPVQPIRLFTWAVFVLAVDQLLAEPDHQRIVVEPDIANQAIHVLNRRAGFVYQCKVDLPGKTGWLAFCTRGDFRHAMQRLAPAHAAAAGRRPESGQAEIDA